MSSNLAISNLRYGNDPAQRLDVYLPPGGRPDAPTIVWAHGGGWVGGSKDEISAYLAALSREGFAVVGLDYTLAPTALYPTPVRQVFEALAFLARVRRSEDELSVPLDRVSPDRIVLAGDSAGANIVAQAALAAVDDQYADEVGVADVANAAAAHGVRVVATALQCGVYDSEMMRDAKGSFAGAVRDMLAVYTGQDAWAAAVTPFSRASVLRRVTADFPPTFISSGNNDDLTPQSKALAERLVDLGVEVSALFFSRSARPRTGHEYQFDLASVAGRANLGQMVEFLGGY